jgi:hypothetical protein
MTQIVLTFPQEGGFTLSTVGIQGPGGGGGVSSWDDLTDKPTEFPPEAHTHTAAEINDFEAEVLAITGGGGATDLDSLTDVDAAAPAENDVVLFDGAQWVNSAIVNDLIGTVSTLDGQIAQVASDLAALDSYVDGTFFLGLSAAIEERQLLSEKDQPDGYAGLDGAGKINPSQLPAIAITDRFVVVSQAAMLALTAETGDIAIRTDVLKTFMLNGDPTVLANWQELLTPTDAVQSVFGRSGTVTAQSGDYTTAQVTESGNLYHTAARVRATDLTGYSAAGSLTALTATDTFLEAMGKIGRYLVDLGTTAFTAAGRAMLTAADAAAQTALLNTFTSSLKGLVPASGGGTTTFLRADGTFAVPAGGGGVGPDKFQYFTDCYSAVADMVCQAYTSNGSAGIVAWPFGGSPSGSGFMRLAITSTSTGRAGWGSANIANATHLRQGLTRFRTRGSVMTLSDGTNSYDLNLGFLNDLTAAPTYGVFFRYNHAVNGGRWEAVTVAGGSPTVADTGVTAVIDDMTVFEIEVNAAGTSVDFKIDGATVATITTTIPGAGINVGFGDAMRRNGTGPGAVNGFLIDYILVEQEFTGR